MADFEELLEFIGAENIKETKETDCSLWTMTVPSAFGREERQLFQVRNLTSNEQIERDVERLRPDRRHVIISTRQEPVRVTRVLERLGFKSISAQQRFAFDYARYLLGSRRQRNVSSLFVNPTLRDTTRDAAIPAIAGLSAWLMTEERDGQHLGVLVGAAGFGKSTVVKQLEAHLMSIDAPLVPILITRENWSRLFSQRAGSISFGSIVADAIVEAFPDSKLGNSFIDTLISQRVVVPIFDGLDELCSDSYYELTVEDINRQLEEILSTEDAGRIIVTSRATYWTENVPAYLKAKYRHFEMLPFDGKQRRQYLSQKFGDSTDKVKRAEALLDSIDSITMRSTGKIVDDLNFSSSPYVVFLVALAIEQGDESAFSPTAFANANDPLDGVLESLCTRENDKVGVEKSLQLAVLLDASLQYGAEFEVEQFDELLGLYGIEEGKRATMQSHHLLVNRGGVKAFLFYGLSDYLRAKAICLWLFKRRDFYGLESYMTSIKSEFETSVDIFASISQFYGGLADIGACFSETHVRRVVAGDGGVGLLRLYSRVARRVYAMSRSELSKSAKKTVLGGRARIAGAQIRGELYGTDFSAFDFVSCRFEGVTFRDCVFDDDTQFERCEFVGDFELLQCKGFGEAKIIDCPLVSSQAKAAFAKEKVRGASSGMNGDDIDALFAYVLRRFLNGSTFRDISEEGMLSFAQKKNSFLAGPVIDALKRHGVITYSRKGGTTGRARVGIERAAEVGDFLDNGVAMGSLRKARADIKERYER